MEVAKLVSHQLPERKSLRVAADGWKHYPIPSVPVKVELQLIEKTIRFVKFSTNLSAVLLKSSASRYNRSRLGIDPERLFFW